MENHVYFIKNIIVSSIFKYFVVLWNVRTANHGANVCNRSHIDSSLQYKIL